MGFALLASLSLLAALAALAVALRGWASSRAELLLATACLWTGLVCVPALALGWSMLLTPRNLALAVGGSSVVLLGLGVAGRAPLARARRVALAVPSLLLLPLSALREAWRERSIVVLGLAMVYVIVPWTAWLAWLAPSSGWDGIWYHDTMVGLTLQHQGFAWVEVPPNLEFVNAYPKTSEMLSLWMVAFTDRRFIEGVNSVYAPVLLVAFFLLARRHAPWRVGAMGFAVVLLMLPAIVLQLRSTYVDLLFIAMFMAAAYFVTRADLRVRDVLLAGLCIGLVGGMKGTGMVLAPLLAGLLALRVLARAWRRRSGWPLAAWVLAASLAAALAAPFYVRNYVLHDNPAWPLRLENELLGIEWRGHWVVSSQRDAEVVLKELFSPPKKGEEFHDTRTNGYGNGPPFLLLPIALIALVWAPLSWLRARLASRGPPPNRLGTLLFLVLPTLGAVLLSPAWWWARFNLHGVVALFLLAFWLIGRPKLRPFAQGVVGALLLASLITLWWSDPGWEVDRETAFELAAMDASERAVTKVAWGLPERPVAEARERELGRGDVVAFTEHFGFPATLYNERLDNRLVYVPFHGGTRGFLEALEDVEAEWAVVQQRSRHLRAVQSRPDLWERVGMTTNKNIAFRRTSMPFGSPGAGEAERR